MLIVIVHVNVKPECVDAFAAASRDNAAHSAREPGIARFDVLQEKDDPTRFILIEVYRNADAPAAHKTTEHYLRWRAAVEPMMAAPRRSVQYHNRFPEDGGW